jgi:hypothetical protein
VCPRMKQPHDWCFVRCHADAALVVRLPSQVPLHCASVPAGLPACQHTCGWMVCCGAEGSPLMDSPTSLPRTEPGEDAPPTDMPAWLPPNDGCACTAAALDSVSAISSMALVRYACRGQFGMRWGL